MQRAILVRPRPKILLHISAILPEKWQNARTFIENIEEAKFFVTRLDGAGGFR
jgi:hypothetical protein